MQDDDRWGMMRRLSRWLLASVLLVVIMLGWLGDSLLSVVMRRPMLSFREVYGSWKKHLRSRDYQHMN